MIIAFVVIVCIVFLALRAVYTLRSVSSFKKAWAAESQRKIEEDAIVIAALGDSTVQGIGALRKEDGFVGQVAARVENKTGKTVQVYNFSVSGAESSEVLQTQIEQFIQLSRVDVVLLAVGPNDITHKIEVEDFLKNYEAILKQLPAEKTVVASLPPMNPKDTKGRSSEYWGHALLPIAKKYNIAVAPVFDKVKPRAKDYRTYGGDFYHPSKAGYKLWADAFEEEVLKILN